MTDKQDKELLNNWCEKLVNEGSLVTPLLREMLGKFLAKVKAHYEPLIQESRKATEAYGELKYDEGLLDGIQQAVKAERERTIGEIDLRISLYPSKPYARGKCNGKVALKMLRQALKGSR